MFGDLREQEKHILCQKLLLNFNRKESLFLIVSHSNVSVDGVAKKIDELLRKKGKEDILKERKGSAIWICEG